MLRAVFLEKLARFVERFVPKDLAEQVDFDDFDYIFSLMVTHVAPLRKHIREHDDEFLLELAKTVTSKIDFDSIWSGIEDKDLFWRYTDWFLDWYQEFTEK